jgi:hypothetical protein
VFAVIAMAAVLAPIAFGVPSWASAKSAGAPRPFLEGAHWTIIIIVATAIYSVAFAPDSSPVNSVTTADMAERTEYYSTWHYPPELVWGFWLSCAAVVIGSVGPAFFGRAHDLSIPAGRICLFIATNTIAVLLALTILALFGLVAVSFAAALPPWLQPLPIGTLGLGAGTLMGVTVTWGRRRLVAVTDRPAPSDRWP